MNHADVRNHMADYLEGDLALSRRALFDAHLDECGECAQEIDEMRGTISLLRGLPDPPVPPDLANQVMRRLRSGEGQLTILDRVRMLGDLLISPRVLAPASAAALAAGLLMVTGQIPTAGSLFDQLTGGATPSTASPTLRITLNPEVGASQQLASAESGSDARSPRLPDGSRSVAAPQAFVVYRDPASVSYWGETGAMTDIDRFLDARTGGRPLVMRPSPSGQVVGGDVRVASRNSNAGLGTASARASESGSFSARGLPSSDEWLAQLQRDPDGFVDWLSKQSLAEQELWVNNLARRAYEQGNLDTVVASLQSSQSRSVQILADDFSAARDALLTDARDDSSGGVD